MAGKLTDRERIACAAYAAGGFQSQAAALRDAGYAESTATKKAPIIFGRPAVAAEVKRLRQQSLDAMEVSAKEWSQLVGKVVKTPFGRFIKVNDDGSLYWDFTGATEAELDLIDSLQVETYQEGRGEDARQVKKFKVIRPDRLKTLDMIARFHGLYEKDNRQQQAGQLSLADALRQAGDRHRIPYEDLPTCHTTDEALQLPAGSYFKDPDGKVWMVPNVE